MTVLLAAQLFAAAALCAGACCISDVAGSVSAKVSEAVSQKGMAEPAMESSHCHGKKSSKPKPKSAANISASHRNCHNATSSTAINVSVCACAIEGEERLAGLLPAKSSEVSLRNLLIAETPPDWRIEASPPQTISPRILRAHSPPQSKARLNLRI